VLLNLIANSFRIICPIHKRLLRLVAQQLCHGNGARLGRLCDFLINEVIVKLDVGGVGFGVGVVNVPKAGPVNGGQAHGAGFATCVNNCA